MTTFDLSLLRGTGAAAPRADWARPTIGLFGCRLWDCWSDYLGVDSPVEYGVVDETGSMLPFEGGDVDQLLASIDAGAASLMSVHRYAPRWEADRWIGSVRMTYLFPYEPDDRAWMDAWSGLRFHGNDPELNRKGSMPGEWWAAAAELMVAGAVAFDAWYGSALFHLQLDLLPHGRLYGQTSFPRWGEGEVNWLPGLAPVFLVSPRMLDPMGGLDGLSRAPVHEVLPVEYRDGRTGAVVRIGADDPDMVRRIEEAYGFFERFMRPPTGKGDVWPAGAARRAFE